MNMSLCASCKVHFMLLRTACQFNQILALLGLLEWGGWPAPTAGLRPEGWGGGGGVALPAGFGAVPLPAAAHPFAASPRPHPTHPLEICH